MRRMIIHAIDTGKGNANKIAKKINILNAVHMMFNAWNSFYSLYYQMFSKSRKCSFSGYSDDYDYDENDSYDEEFNDWMTVDDDLPIYHMMDDGEIVNAVLEKRKKEADNSTFPGEDNDGDDDEEEERIPVKRPEILNAMDLLSRALEENEVGDLNFTTLNEIEAKLLAALPQKQSIITDFFRK
ncbi:hypothetical protein PGB90_008602 [Kerria lacca]